MAEEFIKIRGARVHNLKNIDVDIPRNKLVVITGISGSGKSSLAFDTIYAEGQRRYVESLSAYARQFLGVMQKPDVDKIEGISPAISISQRTVSHNPRSTVGTITEIYDYLRLLFSRIGKPHCPKCGQPVSRQTVDQIVEQILNLPSEKEIIVLGPVLRDKKGEHKGILEEIKRAGFLRVRVDGIIHLVDDALAQDLDRQKKHSIDVVVDRLSVGDAREDRMRLVDSVETALKLGKGLAIINTKYTLAKPSLAKGKPLPDDLIFSELFACPKCGINLPEIEPRLFSFNSPYGACLHCTGLGEKLEVDPKLVIPNPKLSIAEGAIRPWMRVPRHFMPGSRSLRDLGTSHRLGRQSYFWYQLEETAQKHNISLNLPVKDLPKEKLDIILFGDKAGFEGFIPSLEKKYYETESDWTKEEIEKYMVVRLCPVCKGKRLKPEVLAVAIAGRSIDEIVEMSVSRLKEFFEELLNIKNPKSKTLDPKSLGPSGRDPGRFATQGQIQNPKPKTADRLTESELRIASPIIKEILNRLQFLVDVGLDYLTLDRKAQTLAGGESQRIQLATQIGSKLTGVTYILDEPSIGLHPRDQGRLIETLKKLRDLGNTIIVVEHDPQTIRAADWIIDIGPGAGKDGGRVIFEGTPRDLLKSKTLTGEYLSGKKRVEVGDWLKVKAASLVRSQELLAKNQKLLTRDQTGSPDQKPKTNYFIIKGAAEHNLKNIDVKIPLGRLVCITGVSGSGKSSLVNDILARALLRKFYGAKDEPGKHKDILGTENIDKVVLVDQSPIGRTPRSNPATYTGAFSYIRDLFTQTREARIRGYDAGRFSFNVKGGRCEACEGQGVKKIEMYFLPDVYVECEECKGKRYNKEVLQIEYRGKNIAQVLEMTVEEAYEFFKNIPGLEAKLGTLKEVGLGYIQLGQPAPSLSGGEAQRIKLAEELSKRETGKTLYILDEPTTGLHFDDIKKLLFVLKGLVEKGNTVLIVEHNLDVIKNTDWIIDMGPEGGDNGGEIVAEGSPREISKIRRSYTGQYLKSVL